MFLFSADSIIIFIFSIPEEQAISYDSPDIISIWVDTQSLDQPHAAAHEYIYRSCFGCDCVLNQKVKLLQPCMFSKEGLAVWSGPYFCVCVCVIFSHAVKEKLTADPDSEIATTSLRVSLLCPVK